MSSVMLIDGNHLCHRSYHKFSNLKTIDGKPTSITYGFPMVLSSLIHRLNPDYVVTFFDGNKHKFRTDLLPTYKERDHKLGFDYEDFLSQKQEVMELMPKIGITTIFRKGYEADDLIYYFFRKARKLFDKFILVSGDKDFNQLINKQFIVYNPNKDVLIDTREKCKEVFGYYPEQCVGYLSLLGDSSDNIPGLKGVGEKTAKAFFEKYASIKQFLESKDNFNRVDRTLLEEVQVNNKKLIDIKYFYRKVLKTKDFNDFIYREPDWDKKAQLQYAKANQTGLLSSVKFIKNLKSISHERIKL